MNTFLYRRERARAIPIRYGRFSETSDFLADRRAISNSSDASERRPYLIWLISDFASLAASFYDASVLELEVYAAGVRDLNKILELDIELGAIGGLHYKVDRNHDIVYMELEAPTVTFREIRSIFRKLGLEPKFVGAIPAELRPKTKTQLLGA
jgi:hypothetical protein